MQVLNDMVRAYNVKLVSFGRLQPAYNNHTRGPKIVPVANRWSFFNSHLCYEMVFTVGRFAQVQLYLLYKLIFSLGIFFGSTVGNHGMSFYLVQVNNFIFALRLLLLQFLLHLFLRSLSLLLLLAQLLTHRFLVLLHVVTQFLLLTFKSGNTPT